MSFALGTMVGPLSFHIAKLFSLHDGAGDAAAVIVATLDALGLCARGLDYGLKRGRGGAARAVLVDGAGGVRRSVAGHGEVRVCVLEGVAV